jgi:predicted anti-sigma-YlaC factor YlaD
MTNMADRTCDDVLVAVMAALDGERSEVPRQVIDSHLGMCAGCRAAVEQMTAAQAQLPGLHYAGPRVDLWPAVSERVSRHATRRRESMGIALIVAICVAWRTGQLLFEWPLPVLNAALPLAVLMLIATWLIGDPLTIKVTTPELRQERA